MKTYADVEFVDLPTEADAYLLYEDEKRRRPLVLVSRNKSSNRQRFTLAHELGHLVIPWHIGELNYTQNGSKSTMEVEADSFASELLLPSLWIRNVVECQATLEDRIRVALTANCSMIATAIAISSAGSPGSVLAISSEGVVKWSSITSGSITASPPLGSRISNWTATNPSWTIGNIERGTETFWWFRWPQHTAHTVTRTAKQIFDTIATGKTAKSTAEAWTYFCAVTGGLSGKQSSSLGSVDQLYSQFKLRFQQASRVPSWLTSHPRFDGLLSARSKELWSKKK
ncbi:MAG: ImmA/IrrE family metallo-endopeptidase [Phycisphaerales bacterium]|nr:ImmA/IrrE family metallo-endopeptidase [Phycisphaerales bacterium]